MRSGFLLDDAKKGNRANSGNGDDDDLGPLRDERAVHPLRGWGGLRFGGSGGRRKQEWGLGNASVDWKLPVRKGWPTDEEEEQAHQFDGGEDEGGDKPTMIPFPSSGTEGPKPAPVPDQMETDEARRRKESPFPMETDSKRTKSPFGLPMETEEVSVRSGITNSTFVTASTTSSVASSRNTDPTFLTARETAPSFSETVDNPNESMPPPPPKRPTTTLTTGVPPGFSAAGRPLAAATGLPAQSQQPATAPAAPSLQSSPAQREPAQPAAPMPSNGSPVQPWPSASALRQQLQQQQQAPSSAPLNQGQVPTLETFGIHKPNPFKDTPLLPNKTMGVPKAALHALYGKHPYRKVLSTELYHSWNDRGREHTLKWTSVFICPVSAELFLSGAYPEVPAVKEDGGLLWFPRKVQAEHGAAARAFDCLSHRDREQRAARAVLMGMPSPPRAAKIGSEAPYLERNAVFSLPPSVPAEIQESVRRQQETIRHRNAVAAAGAMNVEEQEEEELAWHRRPEESHAPNSQT